MHFAVRVLLSLKHSRDLNCGDHRSKNLAFSVLVCQLERSAGSGSPFYGILRSSREHVAGAI